MGAKLGQPDGLCEGWSVGKNVGSKDGWWVGLWEGWFVGSEVGSSVGGSVGEWDGWKVGCSEGAFVGSPGFLLGLAVVGVLVGGDKTGLPVGELMGLFVGGEGVEGDGVCRVGSDDRVTVGTIVWRDGSGVAASSALVGAEKEDGVGASDASSAGGTLSSPS